jgi:hypothetical protein
MTNIFGRGPVRAVTWEAEVLGPCRHCGVGAEFHGDAHSFDPAYRRPLGVVARWHKNPLVRLWWAVTDKLRRN